MTTIKTITDIKKEQEDKISQLFKDCSVFFAFSNEQFEQNKTPLQEGEKYVSAGAGGYMPKGQVDNYLNGMDAINKWYKAEIKATKGARRANIAYELGNHEAYYTGDVSSTLDALGSDYTRAEVAKVYNEEREAVNARN